MFTSNKYHRIYTSLIESARSRRQHQVETYTEKHHIIPRSIGGVDSDENLVSLTMKEHVLAHRLLTKFTSGNFKKKMMYAYRLMKYRAGDTVDGLFRKINPTDETRFRISNSNKIAWATNPKIRENLKRKRHLQIMRPHTEETKEKIRNSNLNFWGSSKSAEAKALISSHNKGKQYAKGTKRSKEFRDNISEKRMDHTVYVFLNVKTGAEFVGTRGDFSQKFDVESSNVHNLVTGKTKMYKKEWVIK